MKGRLLAILTALAPTLILADGAKAALVGRWTFEGPNPLADLTGNFSDLQLKGNAAIVNGKLNINGANTTASGWAMTSGVYNGPAITEKTLVSWLTVESFTAWAGSALSIDKISSDDFDGIIFGERQTNKWMAGSSFFSRTQDFIPGHQETTPGSLIQLAISYQNSGGQALVKGYRNGVLIGSYTKGSLSTWSSSNAEVFFGIRHGSSAGGPGALDALIEEAHIYNSALSQAEIASLSTQKTVPGPLPLLGVLGAMGAARRVRARLRLRPGRA